MLRLFPVWFLSLCAAALAACGAPPAFEAPAAPLPFDPQRIDAPRIDALRSSIAMQRAALQESLAQGRAQCYQRFFVNRCLRQAQQRYHSANDALRGQELALNARSRALQEQDALQRLRMKAPAASQ